MGEYSLGDALQQFLNRSRLKPAVAALQIGDIWEKLMGRTIARATDKIELHGTTLFIHTNVAPLKQELSMKKELIRDRVNEALKEAVVREVVIR